MEPSDSGLHPVFQRNPVELMQYVYKQVTVTCTGNKCCEGWVFTVDPVTGDMVLKHFDEDEKDITVIMGHCIENIEIINNDTEQHKEDLDSLFQTKPAVKLSSEDILLRFKRLKLWLERNHIPVEVTGKDGDILCIADAVFIDSPYFADNCHSTNEIILGKVQGLVKNLPPDIDEW